MLVQLQSWAGGQLPALLVDFSRPLPLGLPVSADLTAARAWYLPPAAVDFVRLGDWVGSVQAGAGVNFRTWQFNPHAHGTHTESVGHIDREITPLWGNMRQFSSLCALISVEPLLLANGDSVIDAAALSMAWAEADFRGVDFRAVQSLAVRTLPNDADKGQKLYSHTNPPYFTKQALEFLAVELGILHLLTDLPSVDRESDGGKLAGHHAFWQHPENTRYEATITEFIYAPDEIADGLYFLQLAPAPFVGDAAPSAPVLYELQKKP